jgi:hypothetical protein
MGSSRTRPPVYDVLLAFVSNDNTDWVLAEVCEFRISLISYKFLDSKVDSGTYRSII